MTTFVGNISKAAATRYVEPLKTTVTDFNIAENYQGRNGKKYVQFYRVSIWDKRGANLEKYLKSGRPLQINGRVKGRGYLTQEIVDAIKAGADWRKMTIPCQLEIANPQITFVTANGDSEEVEAAAAPEAPVMDEIPEDDKPF